MSTISILQLAGISDMYARIWTFTSVDVLCSVLLILGNLDLHELELELLISITAVSL